MAKTNPIITIYICLVGFALSGNFIVFQDNGLRLLDILMVAGAPLFLVLLATRTFAPAFLWVLFVIGYFLIFALRGGMEDDSSLIFASVRSILAIMAGCAVGTFLAEKPRRMRLFCLVAGIGALCVAWIALGQLLYRTPFYTDFLPEEAKMFWYDGRVRATGIWEHPNSLGQMQAIGTMLAMSLVFIPDVSRFMKVLGAVLFIATILITYSTTQTRAYLLASTICLILAMNTVAGKRMRVWSQLCFLLGLVIFPFFARDLLGERWFGETSAGQTALSQAGERLITKFDSFALSTSNPIGYGFQGRLEAQLALNGKTTASHDAILSFMLTFGVPMGLLIICVLIACFRRITLHSTWPHPLFLSLVGMLIMFQFEDSLFSPSMMMLLSITFFTVFGPVLHTRGQRASGAVKRAMA